YAYGAAVTAPEYEVPEGHTFSGWNVPATMPAQDITLDATLTVNEYTITYTVNGEAYTTQTYAYGAAVTAPEYEVPEGHTFSGWNVPATMPAQDLTLDATLTAYEPVAPAITASVVDIRDRQTSDGKKDMRFVFTVTFNDSCIDHNGQLEGPTTKYYEVTGFGCVLNAGASDCTIVGKSILSINATEFTFSAILRSIPTDKFDRNVTATPYLTYELNGVSTTVNGDPISASINGLINSQVN
ncbi:MAG: InlB B-repeat-containing protein, partial [Clostridia bacterium]|nr:InlB B-repeat-containing protein [Clostridia bacterium]